jgi:hypothetical protein
MNRPFPKDEGINGGMGKKFAIEVTDNCRAILSGQGGGLLFTASEALTLLDMIN